MSSFPVLFVCLGNVCRSPYAELLLRQRLADLGAASRFDVASSGLMAEVGRPMHRRMGERLVGAGASPDGFAARQFTNALVPPVGLVLALTKDIRSRVLGEVPGALRRTFTVLEFAVLATGAPSGMTPRELVLDCGDRRSTAALEDFDVEDPIHAPDEVVVRVSETLDLAVERIATCLAETRD
jgi:protein-tyrosine phosphatase